RPTPSVVALPRRRKRCTSRAARRSARGVAAMHRWTFLRSLILFAPLSLCVGVVAAPAADDASIKGAVVDQLGARVTGATVTLLRESQVVKETKSDSEGGFVFDALPEGRFQIQAASEGFQPRTPAPIFVGAGTQTRLNVALSIGTLETDVTVTAAA